MDKSSEKEVDSLISQSKNPVVAFIFFKYCPPTRKVSFASLLHCSGCVSVVLLCVDEDSDDHEWVERVYVGVYVSEVLCCAAPE